MIAEHVLMHYPPCEQVLRTTTPAAWLEQAVSQVPLLLLDHAHCELKAATTAQTLIRRYPQHTGLCLQLSRLVREEMRHFEQVVKMMPNYCAHFQSLSGSRYAREMMSGMDSKEPQRLLQTLLVAAIIEARSCERFIALQEAPLPKRLLNFYHKLAQSEARHYAIYMAHAEQLAQTHQQMTWLSACLNHLLQRDQYLITTADNTFRFHSGVPG